MKKGQWCRARCAVYRITMHWIFVTKCRKKAVTNRYFLLLEGVFKRVFREVGCALIAFGGATVVWARDKPKALGQASVETKLLRG